MPIGRIFSLTLKVSSGIVFVGNRLIMGIVLASLLPSSNFNGIII